MRALFHHGVVILRRLAAREGTEDEPGYIWYFDLARLRVYGNVPSDLYSGPARTPGTAVVECVPDPKTEGKRTFGRYVRTGSNVYELLHSRPSQARRNTGLRDPPHNRWCVTFRIGTYAPISNNWHL